MVGSDIIAGAMVSFSSKEFLCNGCVGEMVYDTYSTEGKQAMYKLSKTEHLRTLNKWSSLYLITVFNVLPLEKEAEIRVY